MSELPHIHSNSGTQTILVVDDTPQNLTVLGELLQPHYRVRAANSGERALRAAHSEPRPDIILLDVMMPGMDGHEVLRQLRADPSTQDIPVIFITAMDAAENEEFGLSLGAVDYITKPITPAIVLARVRAHLELKQARDRLADQNSWLEAEVARRMRENLLIQDLSVRALASLADARDTETGHHIARTQAYVEILARHLRDHERFSAALAGPQLAQIVKAAPLHDIGKVGIPDAILLKPGKLTDDEFTIMKQHARIGADAISKAMREAMREATESPDGSGARPIANVSDTNGAFAFLDVAREIARSHHEKWDGSGYPDGLAGEAIPVSARIMALADVFDALISKRVYKAALNLDDTNAILLAGRATHFDPAVVDAYFACQDQFIAVTQHFADKPE